MLSIKETKINQAVIFGIILTIGIFILDLLTPLGVAAAIPYIAVILLSFRFPERRHILIAGVIVSILTVLGFFLSPSGERLSIVIANRFLALFSIWAGVIFVSRYRSSIEVINESRESLRKEKETVQLYAEELKRSNAELEQFAYVASHDLQEPLRMVASFTQLLAKRYKDKLDADAHEFISFAVDGANRMQRLINDLLSYSRIETRGKPFGETDFEEILGHARINLQIAIERSSTLITNDSLPVVSADTTQMLRLIQNLIDNAIKFSGDKPPSIHISAEKRDNEYLFSVKDNGIGIDPQFKERIFVIFQRLHSKEEYPGTGIGLAICKRIVERHKGRIWIESEPGNGSVFYFTLPVKVEEKYETTERTEKK
ncbi:MAG: ATP-binding protein [Nitrospira sp.]|nr:ATP-binding protein [Nitrospira sp.]